MGTTNYNFTYLEPNNQINLVGDTTTFLDEIDETIKSVNDTLESEIQAIRLPKKYIFIGDSYAVDATTGSSWITNIVNIMGLTADDYYRNQAGGAGFTVNNYPRFQALLQNVAVADKTQITDIVVCGGYNEFVHGNISAIAECIGDFMNYAKANYPNATVRIGHAGWTMQNTNILSMNASCAEYAKCGRYGAVYMDGLNNVLRSRNDFNSDLIHPTAQGNDAIARYVADCLVSGSCHVIRNIDTGFEVLPGITNFMPERNFMSVFQNDNIMQVFMPTGGFSNSAKWGVDDTQWRNVDIDFGTFNGECLMPSISTGKSPTIPVQGFCSIGNNRLLPITMDVYPVYDNGTIYMRATARVYDESISDWATGAISAIMITHPLYAGYTINSNMVG